MAFAQQQEQQQDDELYLPFPQKPPTADDWTLFRSYITDLYQSKQYTARMVLQELRCHGFVVTLVCYARPHVANICLTLSSEKMLRDRLRAWGLSKNKKRTE